MSGNMALAFTTPWLVRPGNTHTGIKVSALLVPVKPPLDIAKLSEQTAFFRWGCSHPLVLTEQSEKKAELSRQEVHHVRDDSSGSSSSSFNSDRFVFHVGASCSHTRSN